GPQGDASAGAPQGAWAPPTEQAPWQTGGWPDADQHGADGGATAGWAPAAPAGAPASAWGAPEAGGWPAPAPPTGRGPVWDDPAANRAPAGDPWSAPDGSWEGGVDAGSNGAHGHAGGGASDLRPATRGPGRGRRPSCATARA